MEKQEKKIAVCMVVGAFYPEISGGTLQAFSLMQKLKNKIDFYVIATYKTSSKSESIGRIFTEETQDGIKVFRINVRRGKIISEILSALAIAVIFFKIKKRMDIFHMHGYTRKNYLITLLAKLFKKKTVVKASSFGLDDPLSIRKRSFFISKLYSFIDNFVAISPAMENSHKASGLSENRVFLIPNGVDLNRFNIPSAEEKSALRRKMNIADSSKVILSVSFFSRDKGLDIFADSLLLIPRDTLRDIFLIFVGSKDDKEFEVDRSVVKKVDSAIERLGMGPRTLFIEETHEIEKYFKVSDIFIFPSKREGLPNALLEAMACGLYCIANRIEGITDYIIDNENSGYLLDRVSGDAIADGLKKGIGDKILRINVSRNARLKIEREFNLDKVRDRYLKLYRDLMLERANNVWHSRHS